MKTIKTKAISYNTKEHAFWLLATVCVAIVLMHAYAVFATTRNVAARNILEKEVSARTLSQGSLEFALIKKRGTVDMPLALERGYKEVRKPAFASRTSASALSINTLSR